MTVGLAHWDRLADARCIGEFAKLTGDVACAAQMAVALCIGLHICMATEVMTEAP